MFSERAVGFHLTLAAEVDKECGDHVQLSANAPAGADAAEVAARLSVMRAAVWLERIAVNRRILERTLLVKRLREEKLAALTARGTEYDAEMAAEDTAMENTAIVKLEAQIEADEQLTRGA